jgi:uncharacterized protein YqeY
MSLEISWMRFKAAMRAKDTVALEALRAIKSELFLAKQQRIKRRNLRRRRSKVVAKISKDPQGEC